MGGVHRRRGLGTDRGRRSSKGCPEGRAFRGEPVSQELASAVGLVTGEVRGAFLGIMAVAIVGAVLGGIIGAVLRRLVRGKRWPVLRFFPEAHDLPRPAA